MSVRVFCQSWKGTFEDVSDIVSEELELKVVWGAGKGNAAEVVVYVVSDIVVVAVAPAVADAAAAAVDWSKVVVVVEGFALEWRLSSKL